MAQVSLPSAVNFAERLPQISDNVRTDLLTVQPTNGQTFGVGGVITFDLPARSGLFLDGKTMFIRYRLKYTTGTDATSFIRGTPAYAAFTRLDEFVGSTPISSVYNFNQVANLIVNTQMDVAQKYGIQAALGMRPATTYATAPTLEQMDGSLLAASQTNAALSFAAPLYGSAIQSADHYIPTGLMPPLRVQLTVSQLADWTNNTGAQGVSAISIDFCELCVSGIDLGVEVERLVASMSPKLYLKCSAWANQGQAVGSGSVGQLTIPYNHRYKSVENLYLSSNYTSVSYDLNGWADSRDLTSLGTYQFQIGSQNFPNLPIDAGVNKPAVLMYLRECAGSNADFKNSMSINSLEFFNYLASASGTATTQTAPSKFIVGVPLAKIQGFNPYAASSLLSGVDCSSMPIIANVRIATATDAAVMSYLIANYTCLIEIDPMSRSAVVIA